VTPSARWTWSRRRSQTAAVCYPAFGARLPTSCCATSRGCRRWWGKSASPADARPTTFRRCLPRQRAGPRDGLLQEGVTGAPLQRARRRSAPNAMRMPGWTTREGPLTAEMPATTWSDIDPQPGLRSRGVARERCGCYLTGSRCAAACSALAWRPPRCPSGLEQRRGVTRCAHLRVGSQPWRIRCSYRACTG
jgi:hypothetical protein